jgi:hypothetical protein
LILFFFLTALFLDMNFYIIKKKINKKNLYIYIQIYINFERMNELPEEKKKALKDMYIVKSIIKKT